MTGRRVYLSSAALALVCCTFGCEVARSAAAAKNVKPQTIVGIDLGTTYSCIGVFKNGNVEIIANDQGNRITPSYVAFTEEERLFGDAAKNQASNNPTRTIYDVKRLIGRNFMDPEVQHDAKMVSYKVVDEKGNPYVHVEVAGEHKFFSPEEISAMLLSTMKATAETYLGQPVKHAVVTVPAYFNDAQRQATKNAGAIAGLSVERVINEPTAAALAYGLGMGLSIDKHNILVFDLGGGTFDVSILTVDNGVFEVIAVAGDTHLGGEDFDHQVMNHFIKLIKKKHRVDISKDVRALQKLRRECERAKRALSSLHQVRVEVDGLAKGVDLSEPLSRARFEELNTELFQKTLGPVMQAMEDAKMKKEDIQEIVLVGGSTRIPMVQRMISDYFDGKQPNKGVNPDEAVAYGATLQAALLSADGEDKTGWLLVVDVVALSMGIQTLGGVMSNVIPRNTAKPVKKTQRFSTVEDNQEIVAIKVFEGERAMSQDNHKLGQFNLSGIKPAAAGVPSIMVTFEVDINGILKVTANDQGTGKSQNITIKNDQNGFSEEEINDIIQEALKYDEQDKASKLRVQARNSLERYCLRLKKIISGKLGHKLYRRDKSKFNHAVESALTWLNDNQDAKVDDYKKKRKDVENVCSPILIDAGEAPVNFDDRNEL